MSTTTVICPRCHTPLATCKPSGAVRPHPGVVSRVHLRDAYVVFVCPLCKVEVPFRSQGVLVTEQRASMLR